MEEKEKEVRKGFRLASADRELHLAGMGSILVRLLLWGAILASIPAILYFIIVSPDKGGLAAIVSDVSWWLLVPCFAVSLGTLSYFLMQALLAFFYKDLPPGKEEDLPLLTVIVPAYNEGKYVTECLASVLESDYPQEKLEVIAVNDGSEDDTWEWILYAKERSSGRIKAINLPQNGGKKLALCAAMQIASGEVAVTVDSDSRLTRSALRNITARFANPKVGAVAGNVRVSNMEEGVIPKMLEVTFAFGFEFMRTGQSQIHSVLCTPGALSAYRLCAVRPLLETWKKQTFMGKPSRIGEDRAITSLLIRNKWFVEFQRDAVAFTRMPVTYRGVCKMLIRWCRSDVRENLGMTLYAFGTFRLFDPVLDALRMNILFADGALVLPFFWLPMLVTAFLVSPLMTLLYTAGGAILWSLMPAAIYAMRYDAKDALWAFVYGVYSVPFISWICVYSILTAGNSDWMTRSLASSGKKEALFPAPETGKGEAEESRFRAVSPEAEGKTGRALWTRRLTATQRIARRKLRGLHHFSSFPTHWK